MIWLLKWVPLLLLLRVVVFEKGCTKWEETEELKFEKVVFAVGALLLETVRGEERGGTEEVKLGDTLLFTGVG